MDFSFLIGIFGIYTQSCYHLFGMKHTFIHEC